VSCAPRFFRIGRMMSSQLRHRLNPMKRLDIMIKNPNLVSGPAQGSLDLDIAIETEIDGVGMGVRTDGTPFLTLRGRPPIIGRGFIIRSSLFCRLFVGT